MNINLLKEAYKANSKHYAYLKITRQEELEQLKANAAKGLLQYTKPLDNSVKEFFSTIFLLPKGVDFVERALRQQHAY